MTMIILIVILFHILYFTYDHDNIDCYFITLLYNCIVV
jgi:hypothetical protein